MTMPQHDGSTPVMEILRGLARYGDELPDEGTDEGRVTREFFANNWSAARDGLLARTDRMSVRPFPGPGPRIFSFEVDLPYKRKRADGSVALTAGPIQGTIAYRADILSHDPTRKTIVVTLATPGYFHPNFIRRHGILCLGGIPRGPFPLDALLEHLYGILSYQNRDSTDPADLDAVRYFSTDPAALEGLDTVPPLY